MDEIEARLAAEIRARFGVTVQPADDLAALGVDSVEMAGFARDLEERFGISVDEDVFDVTTLADLAGYVRARLPPGR